MFSTQNEQPHSLHMLRHEPEVIAGGTFSEEMADLTLHPSQLGLLTFHHRLAEPLGPSILI